MYRVTPEVAAQMSLYNPYVGTSLGGMGMAGAGFWDSVKNIGSKVNKFLKDTQLISKTADALSSRIPQAAAISGIARRFGYGKRRKSSRKKRGGTNTSLKGTGKRKRRTYRGGSKRSTRRR
jgi:hypothetical protein